MKKSIIFDLDGTLWDTSKEIEQIWKKVAKDYYIEFNEEKIKQIMGFTKKEIIEYLFKGNSEKGNEFITECQENENKYLRKNGGYIYKNTIKTLLYRLIEKGAVKSINKKQKENEFKANISKEKYLKKENQSFLNKLYNGNTSNMLLNFVENKEISKEELKKLIEMIED